MSFVSIPLPPTPNPSFSCRLDDKNAQITLTTTDHGLYADVIYDGTPVALGRLCLDRVDINPNRYLGMPQFLGFVDLQGAQDPTYDGFNTRYLLVYGSP
jgi:hypothetical protein